VDAGDCGDGMLCDYVFLFLPGCGPHSAIGSEVASENRHEIS